MSAITLQFCSFNSLMGEVIDWGTHGSVGHVDFVLPEWDANRGDLLGAQHEAGLGGKPAGVQIRWSGYGAASGMVNRVRVSLPTTQECEYATYMWALDQVGKPYDTNAIVGIALNRDLHTAGHFICSGLAAGALTQASHPFVAGPLAKPWQLITPEELLLICSAFAPLNPLKDGV